MALAIPQSRGELDALKSNITGGTGHAANQVRQRNPDIQAAYDAVAAQIRNDAAARTGADAETQRQQSAGMAAAAQSLGVQPVSLGENSRSARLSKVLSAQYNGNAGGFGDYLGTMRDNAVGRNNAAAATFDEQGRVMNSDFERQFADYLAALSGGGGGGRGGGGGGGGGYDDEELLNFPTSVAPMTKGVIQGLAATSRRLTLQGAAMPKDYRPNLGSSSSSGRRPATTASRRGSGGTF